MLQNAYFLAKIGADTAENEQPLPKFCQKLATTLRVKTGRRGAEDAEGGGGDPGDYLPCLAMMVPGRLRSAAGSAVAKLLRTILK